ncbi:hypothetical protein K505DRAFT_329364 [Melanomma pulvis-pyrius CBS 109.77]|uniref:Uncharacterized protein n=1 Tax=Melanomma pulvis-pyrius CBS 109.77 TaxID=1314802 RepID=A0A6A6WUU5_9PLEO|nr:hypothetical protein K505DRAFT_329364 [Melanomma pulvis-pyrius CBS 109.77]
MDKPPPPYSATAISQNDTLRRETAISKNHTPQRDPVIQFRRYLLEIMAFTFQADFALLDCALDQHTLSTSASISTTNSILTEDERFELLRLARTIKDLYGKTRGYQWLNTLDSDRSAVTDAIAKPAVILSLDGSYILQLISTYADHQCDETKRKHTLISLSLPYPLRLFRHLTPFLYSLGHHLDSHARIIAATAPHEEVRIVLGNAMKVFQEEELGIKKVPYFWVNDDLWPHRFGWYHVYKALLPTEEDLSIYLEI